MNDWAKETLTRYLSELEAATKAGIDTLSQEIPQYVRELLNWMFVENCIDAAKAFIPALILSIVAFKLHRYIQKNAEQWDIEKAPWPLLYAFVFAACVGSLVCINDGIVSAKKAVKVRIAPRVIVVEEISKMLNK